MREDIVAGDNNEISIIAVDAFNNVVKNYNIIGKGVNILSTGKEKIFPHIALANEFINGQAKINVRYNISEDIRIIVKEIGKNYQGMSDVISVAQSIPAKYEIEIPNSATAGQRFRVKIIAYNQFNGVMKNYSIIGPDINLVSTGSGELTSNTVLATKFFDGIALINVQYNKAEPFSIKVVPIPKPKTQTLPIVSDLSATPIPTISTSTLIIPPKIDKQEKKSKTNKGKRIFEIKNISIIETDKQTTLVVEIPNINKFIKYVVTVPKSGGACKEIITLKINSTVSKIKEPLKIRSEIIKNIAIKSSGNDSLLNIELIDPLSCNFRVSKDKKSIILKFKN